MTTANHPWGRVGADGTVYVRTADGERVIGSWQVGSPEEALAFFRRKYESLETEVSLLEQQLTSTDLSPAQAQASVERLRKTIVDANALGDLDQLTERLDKLAGVVGHKREEVKTAREQARQNSRGVKERIVDEAEHIAAEATHWKSSGERMRELLEEWKAAPHAERAVEAALWKRLSAARNAFTKRRKAYLATLEEQHEDAQMRKEKLVVDAESLATSTAWGPTAGTFRDLMRAWKAAGRAGRDAEEELWGRFKAAQDTFFAARAEALSEKEAELREHAVAKQELLEQAQALLPVTDVRAARAALRGIQEKWEQIGAVPRDNREQLEGGLRKVEDAVDNQWRKSNPETIADVEGTVRALASSHRDTELRRSPRKVPVVVYISNEQDAEAVEEAVGQVLESFGMEVVVRKDPVHGSWYRKLTARTKDAVSKPEFQDRLAKMERALDMQVLLRGQAQIDAAQGTTVAQLISSLNNTPNATIQIGSVLLIKIDGVLAIRNLTQVELAHLERHPDLLKSPTVILEELKVAGATLVDNPPRAVGEP